MKVHLMIILILTQLQKVLCDGGTFVTPQMEFDRTIRRTQYHMARSSWLGIIYLTHSVYIVYVNMFYSLVYIKLTIQQTVRRCCCCRRCRYTGLIWFSSSGHRKNRNFSK
jgi:hypothetical protein